MKPHRLILILVAVASFTAGTADARKKNFQLTGKNELCGGIGFAGSLSNWTPGGFKWFNDYSRKMSKRTWFNVQFNIVTGGTGGCDCWWDNKGKRHCSCSRHADGYALELAIGVKLKWRLTKIPLQFHAKFGGTVDLLFFDDGYVNNDYYDDDFFGVGLAFRGGFGVRYFFLPTFGVGAEMIPSFGPAFFNHDVGVEFYGAIDVNFGVEWHF